jgi:hypothetical protein
MRLDNTGNLGIGTSSPNSILELRKDGDAVSPVITLNNRGVNTTDSNSYIAGGVWGAAYRDVRDPAYIGGIDFLRTPATSGLSSLGSIAFYTGEGDTLSGMRASTERMRIDSGGNLLVGTTSANGAALNFGSSKGLNSASGVPKLRLYDDGTNSYGIGGGANGLELSSNYSLGDMRFFTGGSTASPVEQMRIDRSGNLLLGTTTILGGVSSRTSIKYAGGGTAYGIVLQPGADTTNALQFLNASGTAVGSVATTSTTTTYNTSSDYRLKYNVEPMVNALNVVMNLKPVTYQWKSDDSVGEGFIAHELAEQIPLAVTGNKDELRDDGSPVYQAIDTSKIVAHLVAALQELKRDFDEYKAEHP